MEDRWTNKNVVLSTLSDAIVRFFVERGFATSLENSEEEYRIVAKPKPTFNILEDINVYVSGRPNDFKVKFDAGSNSSAFVRLGTLTTIFGGGRLTLKGLKSIEVLEKLEKQFWIYVDRKIWSLASSSGDDSTKG